MSEGEGSGRGPRSLAEEALSRDLAPGALAAVLRYGAETPCREGRVLAWQGDAAEKAFLVLSGAIRPVKRRVGASDVVLPPATAGDWVCLAEMISGAPVQADYSCAGDSAVLAFGERNLGLLRSSPGVEPWISLCLARECAGLGAFLATGGPLERIASFLLSMRRRLAGLESSSVSVTQAEIANSLGLTRETVNKRLGELERRGILETGRGRVAIKDWTALEAIREDR